MRMKGVQETTFSSYNLVDINTYTEEELWKEDNFLSKMLLLEKAKEKNKITEYLRKMEAEDLNAREVSILVQMMNSSLDRKIGEKAIEEFVKAIKNKKGGMNMATLSALEEYFDSLIEQGIEQGIEKGKKENKKAIVIKMLKNKMDEATIKLMTEITKEELEEIKNEM